LHIKPSFTNHGEVILNDFDQFLNPRSFKMIQNLVNVGLLLGLEFLQNQTLL